MSVFDADRLAKPTGDEALRFGERAQTLLSDPVMQLAFDRTELKTLRTWKNATSPAEREKAWAMTHALEELRRELRIIADDGEHARAKLTQRK
jgi:hypothetical protein